MTPEEAAEVFMTDGEVPTATLYAAGAVLAKRVEEQKAECQGWKERYARARHISVKSL